jgi:hypothetical protein
MNQFGKSPFLVSSKDYNHWMLGVDKSDQLIAYYRPNQRCRRVWLPLFFQCLDIIRVNAYIASQSKLQHPSRARARKSRDSHKVFVQRWSEELERRAMGRRPRGQAPVDPTPVRKRRTAKNPQLPPERFEGNPADHIVTVVKEQRRCVYCAHVAMLCKGAGELPPIKRVTRICVACQVHLCVQHFDVYHTEQQEEQRRGLEAHRGGLQG